MKWLLNNVINLKRINFSRLTRYHNVITTFYNFFNLFQTSKGEGNNNPINKKIFLELSQFSNIVLTFYYFFVLNNFRTHCALGFFLCLLFWRKAFALRHSGNVSASQLWDFFNALCLDFFDFHVRTFSFVPLPASPSL